jgi:hypothetical protein
MAVMTVRSDLRAVRQQFTGVLEDDDTVTEQAPALLWVSSYGVSRLAIGC